MSTLFEIGPGLTCDLDLLIPSRMLVQASSGQGKTRTIRRILEQTHGKVQHLVVDPEGEYSTLREKFDYVLASPKGGDVVAHPRYAKVLAEELLRLGVSAILDIYELNPDERRLFVKNFFMGMVDSPRDLWHKCLVVLDEAHIFAPEKGDAVSTTAVEAMSTRGRKRGFCLIAATQRIAKFKKDAAAELGNKLIGGTNLDIDIDRAGEELGFQKSTRGQLRQLLPGEFYAHGRAFVLPKDWQRRNPMLNPHVLLEPVKVKVGDVQTTHPEPGQAAPPTVPPTAKVRAALEKLSALPAEAEEREKSVETLKKENTELKVKLRMTENALRARPEVGHTIERVEVPIVLAKDLTRAETLFERAEKMLHIFAEADRARVDLISQKLLALVLDVRATKDTIAAAVAKVDAGLVARKGGHAAGTVPARAVGDTAPASSSVGGRVAPARAAAREASGTPSGHHNPAASSLKKAERAILRVLAQYPDGCTLGKLTLLSRYRESGGFLNALAHLRSLDLITGGNRDVMYLTDAGAEHGPFDPLPTGPELAEYWLRHPSLKKSAREILATLLQHPQGLTKEDLAATTGYAVSGGFLNSLASLRTAGVIIGKNTERMRAADDLLHT